MITFSATPKFTTPSGFVSGSYGLPRIFFHRSTGGPASLRPAPREESEVLICIVESGLDDVVWKSEQRHRSGDKIIGDDVWWSSMMRLIAKSAGGKKGA